MNLSQKIVILCCFVTLMLPRAVKSQDTLTCNVYGNATSFTDFANTLFKINNEIGEYNGCGTEPSIMVAIIDTNCEVLGTKYDGENLNNDFGNNNSDGGCRARVERHFSFRQNSMEELDSLEVLLNNKIPDGYDVLIYSWKYLDTTSITESSITFIPAINELGWSNFGRQTLVPFILYGEMGNPDSFQEVYGTYIDEFITFSDSICLVEVSETDNVSLKEEEINVNQISIYPNPSNHQTIISMVATVQANVSLDIISLSGEILFTMDRLVFVGENKLELDTEKLESGTYFIRFSSNLEKEIYMERFVKI